MKRDSFNICNQIESRLCKLQQSNVCLKEQIKKSKNENDLILNKHALRIIDILDMIEATQSIVNEREEVIVKKVKKRLVDFLREFDVEEIIFEKNKIEVGKVRVLQTQKTGAPEIISGSIIKVCRKGYKRGNKIIRPADVITAA